jgi:hypothetical protein
MTNPKHILRYGTNADQKYFSGDFEQCYDLIAINAHMIAFSPNALALFVGRQTINKAFFIDPITHLFQHSPSYISNPSGEIKKSIVNLISKYSIGIVDEEVSADDAYNQIKRSLRAGTIDNGFIRKFTENVLAYQENFINEKKDAQDYGKYVEFAREEDPSLASLEIHQRPEFLVAPYFYLEEDNWLSKNLSLITLAKELRPDVPVYAQVVINKKILERNLINNEDSAFDSIINSYKESNADGFLIWIDGYSEHEELSESLSKYTQALSTLRESDKPVHTLYGSYFSILLTHQKYNILQGVAHGLEYGEAREVVPVGGGVPTAKFYFYPLHKRMNLKEMVEILRQLNINTKEQFFEKICNCATCIEAISSDNVLIDFQMAYGQTKPSTFQRGETLVTMSFPTPETKSRSLRHYLYSKKKEFETVGRAEDFEILRQELSNSLATYKEITNSEDYGHLSEWINALSNETDGAVVASA